MAEQTGLRKLLVLRGPAREAEGTLDFLREHFDVLVVRELDGALEAMREHHFDAVLAETCDFLPLERGIVTQQASVALDTIGDGVGIVGSGGELVWTNRRLRQYRPEALDALRKQCARAYEQFAGESAGQGSDRRRRFSLVLEDGTYFEVLCSPVRDRAGVLRQVAAVVVDATHDRRQQMKLNAIDRAGRELVRLDFEALSKRDALQRLALLQERILSCSREVLHYQHFAVLLLDERTNRLETIVSEGLDESAQKCELFAGTENNGISGYVAATGRSYICGDTHNDPRYLPGMRDARSSLTVPLRLHDKVIGVLNVESDAKGAFSEEDRQFAEIFANHVALAMHVLNLLVFERHTTRTQLTGSMGAEIAGPINDIITEAGELMDDYVGVDDLRKRLNALIDLATGVRKTIRQWSEPPAGGVLDRPAPPVRKDPVLTGKKILIADDEELIRNTIRDVLVSYGCQVDTAADGREALKKMAAGRYDLVLSDIKMPGANGYEVFAAARAADASSAVILITGFGYDPHHSIVKANREGLSAVMMKPFKVNQLLDECRNALVKAGKSG